MGDAQAKKSPAGQGPTGHYEPVAFVPVPIDERYRRASMPMQRYSWWQRFTKWLAYYNVQFRWDIERRIARLFHRRWGG